MNTYDIDGVIYFNEEIDGITPTKCDIIITGRSYEESEETLQMLNSRGIFNTVYFNNLKFEEKTRESSGLHKAITIKSLLSAGFNIKCHFDDDPVQIDIIREACPSIKVIYIETPFVEKENVCHKKQQY